MQKRNDIHIRAYHISRVRQFIKINSTVSILLYSSRFDFLYLFKLMNWTVIRT